ncbi:MAG: hypothetical protein B7733_18155 [Myxococcales bacterium FL481]|nr:MAG: hypothetical protein B7733_18155 [Myxococcales bacterium FL481]
MRPALFLAPAFLLLAACVDAPITAAHLAPDGQLRDSLSQDALIDARVEGTAERLEITGVLAVQDAGALEDTALFDRKSDATAVHLHLRVDNLSRARAVRFVWRRGEETRERIDFIVPSDTLMPAAALPLADAAPGEWVVEVYAVESTGDAPLLYRRQFEIT